MKNASKIMYTIGRIFNIIAMLSFVIVLIIGIVALVKAPELANDPNSNVTLEEARQVGITLTVVGGVFIAVYCVMFALATHASKALNNNVTENAPHIIMVIIGVFGDIFYLLGGIFGLIAENSDNNTIQQ